MNIKILIVEDSDICAKIACSATQKLGQTTRVKSLMEARNLLTADQEWSLIVMDISLEDGSGLDFFCELKSQPKCAKLSVIFASGDADISKKSLAFSMGAEDYIVKPYNYVELQIRAERVLKSKTEESQYLTFGEIKVSTHQLHLLTIEHNKESKVDLSPKEYLLLKFLLNHPNQIFSRQQLLDHIWGHEFYITDRTVDSHIYMLRKKMGEFSHYLVSVRGLGYQLTMTQYELLKSRLLA